VGRDMREPFARRRNAIPHVGVTNQPRGIAKTFFILWYSHARTLSARAAFFLKLPNFAHTRLSLYHRGLCPCL